MTRVAIVTSQLPPDLGGTSVYSFEIAKGMGEAGSRPLVLVRDRTQESLAPLGLDARGIDTRRGFLKPLRLRRARAEALLHIRELRADLVLFAYPVTGWGDLYGDLARLGIPYVVSVHAIHLEELGDAKASARRRRKWGLDEASLVLSNTRWMAEKLEVLGVPREKTRVVYLGVDPTIADAPDPAPLRARFGLENKRVVVSVARMTPRKNQHALIRALRSLPDDVVYVLVGDGKTRPELEALARSLGVAARTRFVGAASRQEVGSWFKLAHVHALVPRPTPDDNEYESFGLVYLEAGLCHVPSVGSNEGGVPEAVGDTGLLVDPAKEDEVVAALRRLLDDESLRVTLGEKARARALELFSWSRSARETLAAITSSLPGAAASRR
ncbi:MAG TPA: glycosyltransferase family 4 protein [Planctomycetota bacterium]|nr:glycosyltransferase family 4 protein [Planctomycetota bacterium]